MVRLISLEGNLRFGVFCKKHHLRFLARIAHGFQRALFCSDIPYSDTIDASVHYNHKGFGIVIHPDTIIGPGTDIQHSVTIGEISNTIPLPV